jgi:hypothetical protein
MACRGTALLLLYHQPSAFDTMPRTLAPVDQSPVRRPRKLRPVRPVYLGLDFGGMPVTKFTSTANCRKVNVSSYCGTQTTQST